MTFANLISERLTPDFNAAEDGPELAIVACCDQCRRLSRKAATQPQAIALALFDGWKFRIPEGFKLDGLFSADDLNHAGADIFCPRCASEFEP